MIRWLICAVAAAALVSGCGGTTPSGADADETPAADSGTADAESDAGQELIPDGGNDDGGVSPDDAGVDAGECAPGEVRDCYDAGIQTWDAGICHAGAQTCGTDSTWGSSCEGEAFPAFEICNGQDDDCNGVADDLAQPILTCGQGICTRTVAACTNGQPGACIPGPSTTESCNGVDDDCDGVVDNGSGNSLCTATANTSSRTCSNGTCSIAQCNAGYYNPNGSYADGCECQDDSAAVTCNAATNVGTISPGQSRTVTGRLPATLNVSDYFQISALAQTGATLTVTLTTASNSVFRFNVKTSCGSSVLACTSGTASAAQDLQSMKLGGTNSGANSCGAAWSGTTYFFNVYRMSGAPTCDTYTLSFSM